MGYYACTDDRNVPEDVERMKEIAIINELLVHQHGLSFCVMVGVGSDEG